MFLLLRHTLTCLARFLATNGVRSHENTNNTALSNVYDYVNDRVKHTAWCDSVLRVLPTLHLLSCLARMIYSEIERGCFRLSCLVFCLLVNDGVVLGRGCSWQMFVTLLRHLHNQHAPHLLQYVKNKCRNRRLNHYWLRDSLTPGANIHHRTVAYVVGTFQ